MRLFSNRARPVHLGRLPMERLARVDRPAALPNGAADIEGTGLLAAVARDYLALFAQWRDGDRAPEFAPVTDDPAARSHDLLAGCYFMDADVAGVARLDPACWPGGPPPGAERHEHALVILLEHGRLPETGNLARGWSEDGRAAAAALRAGEIAIVAAGYIRQLGWSARAHYPSAAEVDLARVAVQGGLALVDAGRLANPFLGEGFALAAVTTDYPLQADRPLAESARRGARSLAYWLGLGGSEPGLDRWQKRRRATHRSAFPMERIRRVSKPTTLIHEDEIPRVPKRAAFFERAPRGDLGPKAKAERMRFATKHPFAAAMTPLIAGMVPHQDGAVAQEQPALDDKIGNGNVNWVKRWWQDLEVVGGRTVKPRQANARDLDLAKRLDPAKRKMAYYPASMMPPPDAEEPFPVDRKRALEMAERLETPAGAEARRRASGPRPAIYQPPASRRVDG